MASFRAAVSEGSECIESGASPVELVCGKSALAGNLTQTFFARFSRRCSL